MRKRNLSILVLLLFALLYVGCSHKYSKEELKQKAYPVAKQFASDYLPYDSLVIIEVDTVTTDRYAKILLEVLENMRQEVDMLLFDARYYREEDRAASFAKQLNEIDKTKAFIIEKSTSQHLDNKKIILYMIIANIYSDKEEPQRVYLFSTPNFQLYELDPFKDNLIK